MHYVYLAEAIVALAAGVALFVSAAVAGNVLLRMLRNGPNVPLCKWSAPRLVGRVDPELGICAFEEHHRYLPD